MTFEPLTADRRRQLTRDYLLEAAARVFAERGFHGATLDQVAAAAGFTKGAVYSNFKNKDDLFLALIERGYQRDLVAIQETLEASDVPPEARLGDFVPLMRNEMSMGPETWWTLYLEFVLYALRNPEARERLNALEDEDIRAIAAMIEDGQQRTGRTPAEPPLEQARMVNALFAGLNLMRALNPDLNNPELLEHAMSFAVRALGVAAEE